MVSPGEPTGPHNCPPTQVGETGFKGGRDLQSPQNRFRSPGDMLSRCDPTSESRAGGGDVPGEAEGGQNQHHEDQEYVDLGHHDPVFP